MWRILQIQCKAPEVVQYLNMDQNPSGTTEYSGVKCGGHFCEGLIDVVLLVLVIFLEATQCQLHHQICEDSLCLLRSHWKISANIMSTSLQSACKKAATNKSMSLNVLSPCVSPTSQYEVPVSKFPKFMSHPFDIHLPMFGLTLQFS